MILCGKSVDQNEITQGNNINAITHSVSVHTILWLYVTVAVKAITL